MYADDTTIYFKLKDFDSFNLELKINTELQNVVKNKPSLNLDKTKLIIFHRQQKKMIEVNITINGANIECV